MDKLAADAIYVYVICNSIYITDMEKFKAALFFIIHNF